MKFYELNIDSLAGPTHNYGGLAYGNLASIRHCHQLSHPKSAALQGLEKMRYLVSLGVKQMVWPPHERPHIPTLRKLGFFGKDEVVLEKAASTSPELFFFTCSSSSMWLANGATMTPSSDSLDKRVQITPANLVYHFHRSIESEMTARLLQKAFPNEKLFMHHPMLPKTMLFADEGSANQLRFCAEQNGPGVFLFVNGRRGISQRQDSPSRYPARQTLEASQAVARQHRLSSDIVVFAQQNPKAIDEGSFHNDVISLGYQNVFFYHEHAFLETARVMEELQRKMKARTGEELILIPVAEAKVSLKDSVASYLFNSQLVTDLNGEMRLIAPLECQEIEAVRHWLNDLVQDTAHPIRDVHYLDLRESMQNGGGPRCLRLHTVLTQEELDSIHQPLLLTEQLYQELIRWVHHHYRETLSLEELADPQLLQESRTALDALTHILRLGSIYSFQK